jgi:RHS repeat-associated protein
VLDSGGGVLYAQVFNPYGNPYTSAGAGSTSFGFTGEQTDENGLIFLRARYYDPRQERFLQHDLWQGNDNNPLSFNPWMYVFGNPTNIIDPGGMAPIYPPIPYKIYSASGLWLIMDLGRTWLLKHFP